jgi:hypothetical protein
MVILQLGSIAIAEKSNETSTYSSSMSPQAFDDPKWAVGMEWGYRVEMSSFAGQAFEMKGNVTIKINTTATVKIGNNTYDTFKFCLWGGGTMKGSFGGFPIQGTWFMQGRTHTLKNKTENAQTETYVNITSTTIKATSYMITNWTPPEDPYHFPMSVGNKWQYLGMTETYNWTKVQGIGYIAQPSRTTANITSNFSVTKDEYRTVPAGTFYTYLVESSSMLLQPIAGPSKEYYSEAAGNSATIVMMDNASNPTGYYNLTHTNYPPPPGKYGTIKGTVSDQKGTLSGVKITLSSSGKQIGTAKSDASGKYNISNLLAGAYDLLANKSGYEDVSATGITLSAGATVTKDIMMKKPEGSLEVNVKDNANNPLSGVTVVIKGPSDFSGNTDVSGKLMTVLPTGSYTVTASKNAYKNATTSANVISSATSYANLTLEPTKGKLSGKILDIKTGLPIVNAVIALTKNGTSAGQTTSSSTGDYSFDLDVGTYQVSVSAAGYVSKNDSVTITPGQAVVKDVKLTPEEKKVPEKPAEAFPMWLALIPIVIFIVILLLYFMFRKKKPQLEDRPQLSMKKRK